MRRLLLVIVATLVFQDGYLSARFQQPDTGIRGTIRGIVRSPSGEGIPNVQVTLGFQGGTQIKASDAEGRFTFADLAAGTHALRAEREGYFPTPRPNLATVSATATASAIINANSRDVEITISMVQGGTVSGRLRNAEGNPAVGQTLVLLRSGYQDGRRILSPATTGAVVASAARVSNDRGEFRLFWFPPGEYFLRADAPTTRSATAATVALPTFFPGVRDVSRAIPIVVRSGQETSGIDFPIEYAQGFNVSGKVTVSVPGGRTMPDGQLSRPLTSFYVVPQDADRSDIPLTSARTTADAAGNIFDFELRGIAPGRYFVFPLFTTSTQIGPLATTYYSTRIPVEVIDRDVTGLSGEIRAYPDVKVAIVIKGDIAPNAVPPSAIRPILRVQEEMGTLIARPSSLLNPPASDGSFVFPNLLPATYKVLLQAGLPANMYIADIRQAGKSLYADASLTVTGESAAPVEVIVSTGASQIQGTVRHNTGAPVVASVTLVPQINRRQNPMLYKRTTSTANGEFMLRGIAPGEYKIFAWESILSGADENAEFLSKYENLGKSITITPGTALNDVQINLIPD